MKKNTAGQVIGAQMVSATDGSAFTGAVTCYVCGDGGTQAAGSVGSGACTHEGNGYHTYAPAQAETNYDLVAFTFTGTGAVPATVQVFTGYPQTGDSYARLGAPAGASVSADIANVPSAADNATAAAAAILVTPANLLDTDASGYVKISGTKNTLDSLVLNPTLAISEAEALSVAEGELALATYHEFSQTITSTSTDNLGTAVLALGIKVRATDADTAALLLVRSDTGLSRVCGATYATPAHGTLTVSGSSGDWDITVTVTAAVAGLLEPYSGRELPSELKNLTTDRAVWTGKTAVTSGIVKATS